MDKKRFRFDLETRLKLESWLVMPFYGGLENLSESKKLAKISQMLGCSQTTVSREVKGRGFTYDNYNAHKADLDSIRKTSEANAHFTYSKEQRELLLSEFLCFAEKSSWSPAAFIMRLNHELGKVVKIPSLELLYQWIYEDAVSGGKLYKLLPRSHKKRKKHKLNKQERIINKVSIHERGVEANERRRIGDIEIDSVVSAGNKSGINTATDRKSRFSLAKHSPSKYGNVTRNNIIVMLRPHMNKIKTITSDNGTEFAEHLTIAKHLKVKYFFADPYCSNQRGSNENLNGMIRRYFPKGTDFTKVTPDRLQQVMNNINNLPRKIHKGKTAHEVYYGVNKKVFKAKHRKTLISAFRT